MRLRLALMFFGTLILLAWVGHEQWNPVNTPEAVTLVGPEQRIIDGTDERFDAQGRLSERLTFADLVAFSRDEGRISRLSYQRQDADGNLWRLTSVAAIQQQALWHLQEQVQVSKTSKDAKPLLNLSMQDLFYRNDTQDIWTEQAVELKGSGYRVQAKGLKGNIERGQLQLTQQVKTEYEMDP